MIKFVKIRALRLSDTTLASSIHIDTIPGISSALGESYLKNYYKTLIKNHKGVSIGAEMNNRLVGFATATEDIQEILNQMHKLITLTVCIKILRKAFTYKISPLTIFGRINFEKYQSKSYTKPYLSIVTICVDNAYQKKGIGSYLMVELLKQAKKNGLRYIYVDTRESNDKAIKFYKKFKFSEETRIYENVVFRKKLQSSD